MIRNGTPGAPGAQGPQGATGSTGAQGAVGATGAQGNPGIVPMYGGAGLLASPKVWTGTVTTNSSGLWSVSFTTAGFTTVINVQAQPVSSDNTIANATGCSVTSVSTTGCNGIAFKTQVSVLGLLPIVPVAAGTTIQVLAIGT